MTDTSKREELIEAAEVAIREAWAHRSQNPSVQTGPAECAAIAAFAVFEQAHAPTAPTDDEVEALQALDILHRYAFGSNEIGREQVSNMVEIISDHLRRTAVQEPQSEPTDATVQAFVTAINAEGFVLDRRAVKAGLRAADAVREEGQGHG